MNIVALVESESEWIIHIPVACVHKPATKANVRMANAVIGGVHTQISIQLQRVSADDMCSVKTERGHHTCVDVCVFLAVVGRGG